MRLKLALGTSLFQLRSRWLHIIALHKGMALLKNKNSFLFWFRNQVQES